MNKLSQVTAGSLATLAMLVFPIAASAQDPAPDPAEAAASAAGAPQGQGGGGGGGDGGDTGPAPAKITVKLNGLKGGDAKIGDRIEAIGKVKPFVPGQRVELKLGNRGDTVMKKNPFVRQVKGKNFGRVKLRSKPLIEDGKYRVRAKKSPTANQASASGKSKEFALKYPDLKGGENGPAVKIYNDLLRKAGYYNEDKGNIGSHAQRATMAFRKVNGMARTFDPNEQIFKMLAEGNGGFNVKGPGLGKHVEVDISKQVMALIDGGEPKYVFHVSTGAPATPSDRGKYTFYRKDPGFNSIGMYYSVYYNRGEATHGYHSVPTYNASHGCIRNPIPDSVFIYNWINLGETMYVYD